MKEIYERRSIRRYNEITIEMVKINQCIKAGMNAPSSKNSMPWEFLVIQDKNKLKQLGDVKESGSHLLAYCNTAIIVCANENKTEFWEQDLAASMQNMLLEATTQKLSACWVGIHPLKEAKDNVRSICQIPSSIEILGIIALGYSDVTKEENNRFLEERIHIERW